MAKSVPLGIRLLPSCSAFDRTTSYRIYILIFTFFIYTSFHLSRKPISVVKNALFHKNCTAVDKKYPTNSTACDWAPFDRKDHDSLLGSLDLAYLFAYAVGMFLSGHIAERMNLRHFLSLGMLSSGILTAAFGFGYFFNVHVLWFYILVQVVGGMVQASGWPSVVTCVGNWWGKGKRGFIMGVWNSHTSVGNITGSLIAGIWVNHAWGWSFAVPGMIIGAIGVLAFFFLVTEPSIVGCEDPDQPEPGEYDPHDQVHVQNGGEIDSKSGQELTSLDSTKSLSEDTSKDAKLTVYTLDLDTKCSHLSESAHPNKNNMIIQPNHADVSQLQVATVAVNGSPKTVELLSIQNLENQSSKGSEKSSGNGVSILVPGQHGGVPQVKKMQYLGNDTFPMLDVDVEDNEDYGSATSVTPLLKKSGSINKAEEKAIPLYRAVLIPGVAEFSLCLFFAKLVSYTFLFWLPKYIGAKRPDYDAEMSADLSTLFDVGGIAGGISAGIISDYTGARASTCAIMLILAAPMMYIYNVYGSVDYAHTVGLLLLCGFMVNGPYALITTAVSADLGTHKSLKGNSKALATVTAIIDGTGSIGAAIGPLLTGVLWKYGTNAVFWMLIGADLAALVFVLRLVIKEIQATRCCSPPLLVDDIIVDNSTEISTDRSAHL